ncbi:hypothetical protein [Nannocystis pusilla]|uniref:hypothetical protein n=1 Tax=Nannocystis pusilla TaxID=889268 RepID=UPI003B79A0A8
MHPVLVRQALEPRQERALVVRAHAGRQRAAAVGSLLADAFLQHLEDAWQADVLNFFDRPRNVDGSRKQKVDRAVQALALFPMVAVAQLVQPGQTPGQLRPEVVASQPVDLARLGVLEAAQLVAPEPLLAVRARQLAGAREPPALSQQERGAGDERLAAGREVAG